MRYILLSIFFGLSSVYVIAQPENDEVFHATIPTKFYTKLQVGMATPSLQDLKVSNIQWLGSAFATYISFGYEGEKVSGELNMGLYNGIISPLNGSSLFVRNFHPNGNLYFQRKMKRFKSKQIDWWTGAEVDVFYDLRRDNNLDNNRNIETIMSSIAWRNQFVKEITFKKQKYRLLGTVTLPMVGYIGESQSFAFNIPSESFVNGVYNYQSFTPSTVQNMKVVPIGNFFRLKTNIGIERTFDLNGYNKRKLIKVGVSYNWDYLAYQQKPNSRLQLANHQILVAIQYHLTKRNHAGYSKNK